MAYYPYYSECRVCGKPRGAKYSHVKCAKINQQQHLASKGKVCPKCKEFRAVSEYFKNIKAKDGLQCWCSHCAKNSSKRNKDYQERQLTRIK